MLSLERSGAQTMSTAIGRRKEGGRVFQHILAPVDGSDDSWVALEQAIQVARQEKGVIQGLFVADVRLIEAPYLASMYSYDLVPAYESASMKAAIEASKRLEGRGEQILAEASERCRTAGVPCQTEQVEGKISEVILERARQADLIVMGRHGEGARWAGPLLGSTFEAVVRYAPAPVLATQAEVRPTTRLLVAFDGSDRARDGLDIAARWAAERNLPIVLLTVDDGHPGREQAHKQAQALLQKQKLGGQSPVLERPPSRGDSTSRPGGRVRSDRDGRLRPQQIPGNTFWQHCG